VNALAGKYIKPSKLIWHLQAKHLKHAIKVLNSSGAMKRVGNISDLSCHKFSPRTQASYEVVLEIAKQIKPKRFEKHL